MEIAKWIFKNSMSTNNIYEIGLKPKNKLLTWGVKDDSFEETCSSWTILDTKYIKVLGINWIFKLDLCNISKSHLFDVFLLLFFSVRIKKEE